MQVIAAAAAAAAAAAHSTLLLVGQHTIGFLEGGMIPVIMYVWGM